MYTRAASKTAGRTAPQSHYTGPMPFAISAYSTPRRRPPPHGYALALLLSWATAACGLAACDTNDDDSLAAGQCRNRDDCSGDSRCVPQELVGVCSGAACPDNQCNANIDCTTAGTGDVCISVDNVRMCQPACNDSDNPCPAHQQCDATGECKTKLCSDDSACPANYSCSPNQCLRRFCDTDAECQGYCVTGECRQAPGSCVAN